jgi:signal transduction histidine kinase
VQLGLWFVLPLLLVLVALTLSGAYTNLQAIRNLTSQRNVAMAGLYARQIGDGLTRGIVVADGRGLADLMADASVGERGVVYVVDAGGLVIYHPRAGYQGLYLAWDPAIALVAGAETGTVQGRFSDGSPTLASFASVADTGWRVVVEEPVPDVTVPLLRASSTLPILLVAAGFLSLLLIDFSLHTIVQPLRRLAETATKIAWGDWPRLDEDVGGVEEIRHLQNALRDMLERIRHYQESMRDYVDAVTQGQEEERSRLSRELHDDTVQALIAMEQRLQLAQHAVERGDAGGALKTLQSTRELAQQTLDELRRLIRALRPLYLEDLGFMPALETLVREARSQGLSPEIRVEGEARRLPQATELIAFRVAQEALTNAMQHARASQVTLTVSFGEHDLKLSVEDDGAGFVMPETPDTLTQAGHLGLVGMRERVLLAGGRLDIRSQPGSGTRVTASFPV